MFPTEVFSIHKFSLLINLLKIEVFVLKFSTKASCEPFIITSLLGDDIHKIWKKWKSNFKIDEVLKTKVIKWLKSLIEKRVDAIMEGNYRKSYYKAALVVVAYAEMISSQNIETKEEYIRYFTNKYSRRSAFKGELSELL